MTETGLSIGWYLPRKPRYLPRWVLAFSPTHVYYSRGGEKHFECSRRAFKSWVTGACAVPGDPNSLPELKLKVD